MEEIGKGSFATVYKAIHTVSRNPLLMLQHVHQITREVFTVTLLSLDD